MSSNDHTKHNIIFPSQTQFTGQNNKLLKRTEPNLHGVSMQKALEILTWEYLMWVGMKMLKIFREMVPICNNVKLKLDNLWW